MLLDDAVPISSVPALVPGRPHLATVWRWIQRGVRGVKLRTTLCGGRRYTTRAWLDEFFAASTAAAGGIEPVPGPGPSPPRQRSHQQASDELERAGY